MITTQTVIHPRPASERVLVVDDEPLMRWSVGETLRQVGFEVVEAADAKAALAAAQHPHHPFGVVALDVWLPDCEDLSVLAKLRSLMKCARIIVMTAHGTEALTTQALTLGAYCVLDKPFAMGRLADIVHLASLGKPLTA